MDDLDTTLALDMGSAPPATSQSEANEPPSAANNYRGIEDDSDNRQDDGAGQESDNAIDGEVLDGDENDPWRGYVDIELDGQVYKVPDALKDGYYRNKDYTQKAQALAEERREFEARSKDISQALDLSEKERNIQFELSGMVGQLEKYDQVDWDAFEAQEPLAAQSEWRKFQQLQQQFNRKYGELQTAQTERNAIVERDLASRIDKTTAYAYKNLPGMSPELDANITNFAINTLGYDPVTLKKSYSPQIYTTIYLAHLGHQTLMGAQKTPAPKTQAPAQPLKVVHSRAATSGRKTIGEMSMDEYAAHRNAQAKAGKR